MQLKTSFSRTCVAVSGMLVAATLVTGCGQSAAEDRATAVTKNAHSLAKHAGKDAGKNHVETWQEKAAREYWDRQQFYDSWDKITPRTATPSCH